MLIVLFGSLLVATLIIIVASQVTNGWAGNSLTLRVSEDIFFAIYTVICVSINRVCAVILHQNFSLLREWRKGAFRDDLTGLYNRRYSHEQFERLQLHADRDEQSCGLLVIDLDHFKQLNDAFGYTAGDEAVSALGKILRSLCRRPSDFAARFGGDSFVVSSTV